MSECICDQCEIEEHNCPRNQAVGVVSDLEQQLAAERTARQDAEAREAAMREALVKAIAVIEEMYSWYGKNLQVYGWHLNGDSEPLDNIIEGIDGDDIRNELNQALSTAPSAYQQEKKHRDYIHKRAREALGDTVREDGE